MQAQRAPVTRLGPTKKIPHTCHPGQDIAQNFPDRTRNAAQPPIVFLITRLRQPVLAGSKASRRSWAATQARLVIIVGRSYRRLRRYSNSARSRANVFFSHDYGRSASRAALILSNSVLTHLKAGARAACLPLPVFIELCRHAGFRDVGEASQTVGNIYFQPGRSAVLASFRIAQTAEGFDGPKDDLISLDIVRRRDHSNARRLACSSTPAAAGPGAGPYRYCPSGRCLSSVCSTLALQHNLRELVLDHSSSCSLGAPKRRDGERRRAIDEVFPPASRNSLPRKHACPMDVHDAPRLCPPGAAGRAQDGHRGREPRARPSTACMPCQSAR